MFSQTNWKYKLSWPVEFSNWIKSYFYSALFINHCKRYSVKYYIFVIWPRDLNISLTNFTSEIPWLAALARSLLKTSVRYSTNTDISSKLKYHSLSYTFRILLLEASMVTNWKLLRHNCLTIYPILNFCKLQEFLTS